MDDEHSLAEFAVDKARSLGATYAEARFQEDSEIIFFLKNKELQGVINNIQSGIGIRVIVNGSLGFASTDIIEKETIEKTIGCF